MEAPPIERKLVAILAADVQGYSRLMGIDEENTLATLSAHRAITDALIEQHGGRICGTAGDSVLAEFASVPPYNAPLRSSMILPGPTWPSVKSAVCGFASASISAMSW